MKYRFMSAPLRAALKHACLAVSLSCLVSPAIAAVADPAAAAVQPIRFDIAAGPLTSAISAFAATAGISLSFEPALAADKTSAGLSGSHSVDDGLVLLLAGTGLEAVAKTDGGYTLRALLPVSGATLLPVVKVAAAMDETITEGTGSYTARAVGVGGKTPRDPRHIQQSVSVVTAQRIRDQALTTAEEALGQATGVTLAQIGSYTSNASFRSRGFDMSVQTDGGAAGVNYFWYNTGLPDLAILDHIEVLRGSNGLFAGSGNPGGTVNLVRKRALDHNQVVFDALAGSWNRYRTQIDATGPLGWNGKLRGRFVAAQERRDYFYKGADSDKSVLYGVLEVDVTSSTLLSVGSSFEKQDRQGLYFGLPRYSTGESLGLSRGSCLCTDWSGRNETNHELFVKLDQTLGDNWHFRVNLSQQWLDYDYQQGNAAGAVNPATLAGPLLTGGRTDVSNRTKLADVMIDGRFEVFGFKQELLLGGNWQDIFSDGTGVSLYTTRPPVDVFDFERGAFLQPATPASYVPLTPFGGQKQTGIYVTLRSHLTDALQTVIGTRYSSYEYLFPPSNVFYKESGVPTPYAGLTYDLTQALSVYGSYASIFQSQAGLLTASNEALKAVKGNTYELGIKGAWLNSALTASLALYRVDRENAAILDFQSPTVPVCCYLAAGKVRSQGVDAEMTGQLLPGWQLSAGYTYNTSEFESGFGARNGTTFNPQTPEHLLKLWTTAQMPGAWSDLKLGGGVNWQSSNFVNGMAATYNPQTDQYDGPAVAYRYTQGAYAVVSLRGDYRLNEQWSVALNINNLFDKTYYQTVASSNTGNFYGEPRSFLVSVSGRW